MTHCAKQGFVVDNKESGKSCFKSKHENGLDVVRSCSSEMFNQNGACFLSTVEERKNCVPVAKSKWLAPMQNEICLKCVIACPLIRDCEHVVQSDQIEIAKHF